MSAGPESDVYRDEVFTSRFPIHRACRDGDVGALVSLLQQLSHRAPLTAEDSCYGWTPIHWAAHYGQLECVVHLVQMGCEVNTVTSRFNQTPTHTAAFGGHPNCVVWLTQAGADVNRQDFVGEAPVHKAARSGSLECIQVLLIAGAKPQNASGQTAADLAQAHGFHDCSSFISNTQKHPPQLTSLHVSILQSGNGTACGQGLLSRKRPLTAAEAGHLKKARTDVLLQMQSSAPVELDCMNTESAQELSLDVDTIAVANSYHHTLPATNQNDRAPEHSFSTQSNKVSLPLANQQVAVVSVQRDLADMCGSLHLMEGPIGSVPKQTPWWGLTETNDGDPLRYGHYHGFGDTAEELTDCIHLKYSSSMQAEKTYHQVAASSIHLYHGS